ncbi:hypothetical protein Ciccas_012532, partial [Cichlidogyrus casuarinus]
MAVSKDDCFSRSWQNVYSIVVTQWNTSIPLQFAYKSGQSYLKALRIFTSTRKCVQTALFAAAVDRKAVFLKRHDQRSTVEAFAGFTGRKCISYRMSNVMTQAVCDLEHLTEGNFFIILQDPELEPRCLVSILSRLYKKQIKCASDRSPNDHARQRSKSTTTRKGTKCTRDSSRATQLRWEYRSLEERKTESSLKSYNCKKVHVPTRPDDGRVITFDCHSSHIQIVPQSDEIHTQRFLFLFEEIDESLCVKVQPLNPCKYLKRSGQLAQVNRLLWAGKFHKNILLHGHPRSGKSILKKLSKLFGNHAHILETRCLGDLSSELVASSLVIPVGTDRNSWFDHDPFLPITRCISQNDCWNALKLPLLAVAETVCHLASIAEPEKMSFYWTNSCTFVELMQQLGQTAVCIFLAFLWSFGAIMLGHEKQRLFER